MENNFSKRPFNGVKAFKGLKGLGRLKSPARHMGSGVIEPEAEPMAPTAEADHGQDEEKKLARLLALKKTPAALNPEKTLGFQVPKGSSKKRGQPHHGVAETSTLAACLLDRAGHPVVLAERLAAAEELAASFLGMAEENDHLPGVVYVDAYFAFYWVKGTAKPLRREYRLLAGSRSLAEQAEIDARGVARFSDFRALLRAERAAGREFLVRPGAVAALALPTEAELASGKALLLRPATPAELGAMAEAEMLGDFPEGVPSFEPEPPKPGWLARLFPRLFGPKPLGSAGSA